MSAEKKRAYVGLRLPPALKAEIDWLVEKGLYMNVSEFLRQAAREKLDSQAEILRLRKQVAEFLMKEGRFIR